MLTALQRVEHYNPTPNQQIQTQHIPSIHPFRSFIYLILPFSFIFFLFNLFFLPLVFIYYYHLITPIPLHKRVNSQQYPKKGWKIHHHSNNHDNFSPLNHNHILKIKTKLPQNHPPFHFSPFELDLSMIGFEKYTGLREWYVAIFCPHLFPFFMTS